MRKTILFATLADTLQAIKTQSRDSLPFALQICKKYGINQPDDAFYYLRTNTTYKSDPDPVEMVQSIKTLLSVNNFHGISGYGDCDCFTVAMLAMLYHTATQPLYVCLGGKTRNAPTHVWAGLASGNKVIPYDLTTYAPGTMRKYKYTQNLLLNF